MKNILCSCLFLLLNFAYSCAQAQQQDKLTISTYYPAPNAVYRTMRLKPSSSPPADAKPGQLFYNATDIIQYYNKSNQWVSLTGEGSGEDTWDYIPNSTFPGVPKRGDIFFNNTTNTLNYRNMTDNWVNVTAGSSFWQESYDTDHYVIFSANHTGVRRKFLIGRGEHAPFSVKHDVISTADENGRLVSFTKYLKDRAASQELLVSLFPRGAVNSYLNSTSLISVPSGHLKLAVLNKTQSLDLNVGGWWTHVSDVLVFNNPAGETLPRNYSITLGNQTSKFPFAIDSPASNSSVFGVRGTYNGTRKTGIFSVMLSARDAANWTYGCYYNDGAFKNDPYILPNGTQNHYYAVLEQVHDGSFKWWCGDTTSGNNIIPAGVAGWNKANGITLWDKYRNWIGSSSRALKENFKPLNHDEMLRKIDQLDVARWNFKAEGPSVTHIGPVAEDFYRLFKIGYGEKSLASIDTIGVSLAGVKALINKADAQQKKLDELQARVDAVKAKFSK